MADVARVIGIDFGESKCCVAAVLNGQPQVIRNEYGERLTPTCIHFENDNISVGKAAMESSVENPSNTIVGIKRLIGKKFAELREAEKSAFSIVDKDGRPHIEIFNEELEDDAFHVYHASYTPEQLVTIVLKKLKESAEVFFQLEETSEQKIAAVIAVPAYFGINERRAMIESGRMAGLEVLGLINEPTAAAIAYSLNKETSQKMVVFDFGARSVQASVVQTAESNSFGVLGSSQNGSLGGEVIDMRLTNQIVDVLCAQNDIQDVWDKETVRTRLRPRVRDAKHNLTDGRSHTHIVVPGLCQDNPLTAVLTREDLDGACRDLFQSAFEPVSQVLDSARISIDEISQIVMVGGGSRLRAIRALIQEQFGDKPLCRDINPEEAVAAGAAIYASSLANSTPAIPVQISDILTHEIGIMHSKGAVETLFPENTRLPAEVVKTFQSLVDLVIVERNGSGSGRERFVERLSVEEPGAGMEMADVAVCFRCDQSGMLSVTATDAVSGAVLTINNSLHRQGSQDDFEHISNTDS